MTTTQCGTPAGHAAHFRAGTPACFPCRLAHSRQANARNAARRKLAKLYPDVYAALLAEELKAAGVS